MMELIRSLDVQNVTKDDIEHVNHDGRPDPLLDSSLRTLLRGITVSAYA